METGAANLNSDDGFGEEALSHHEAGEINANFRQDENLRFGWFSSGEGQ